MRSASSNASLRGVAGWFQLKGNDPVTPATSTSAEDEVSTTMRYVVPDTALKVTRLASMPNPALRLLAMRDSVSTLLPVYTASSVSISAPSVSKDTRPLAGAVHRNQSDAPADRSKTWIGSPASRLAPSLSSTSVPRPPLSALEAAKLSLGGSATRAHVRRRSPPSPAAATAIRYVVPALTPMRSLV